MQTVYTLALTVKGIGEVKAKSISKYFDLSEYVPGFPYYNNLKSLGLNEKQSKELHITLKLYNGRQLKRSACGYNPKKGG